MDYLILDSVKKHDNGNRKKVKYKEQRKRKKEGYTHLLVTGRQKEKGGLMFNTLVGQHMKNIYLRKCARNELVTWLERPKKKYDRT